MAPRPDCDVLLLDFGGVCLLNPVEMHADAEAALGLDPGTFTWLGPIDPSTDELWRECTTGASLREREYWAQRATDVGRAAGREFTLRDYMRLLYEPPRNTLIRPDAVGVVQLARDAGYGVSILTNDMRTFHGPDWEAGIDFFSLIDHVVDCSDTNILKPDPRAYARAAEIVGVEPQRMFFVDDQLISVKGAESVGLHAVWFDIAHATNSWAGVAEQLGLQYS